MTDTQSTDDTNTVTETEQPEQAAAPAEAQAAEQEAVAEEASSTSEETEQPEAAATEATDDDGNDDGDHDELPEWGRKQLTKARKDAANYRQRLAEANEKLAAAKSTEDFEAVQQELAKVTLALETERIANRHGLPEELRAVLRGDSAEEVEANAALLAKFVTGTNHVNPDDLSGGLDPSTSGAVMEDPRTLARKHRR